MAFDPASGLEGRVRIGAGDTVVAGIRTWRITKRTAEIPVAHFEAAVDGDSNVWPGYEKGLTDATVQIEGHYDVGTTPGPTESGAGLRIGVAVSLDLYFTRTPFGYTNVAGFVTSFEAGTNIDNQTATFTMTVRCTASVGSAA
jgi:hypothetical protein